MPLDDALSLVARSFEKFLQAEKEKVAALSSGTAAATTVTDPVVPSVASHVGPVSFLPPPKEISYLLNLLADNRQLTADELDKVIAYLKERKSKLLAAEGIPPVPEGERWLWMEVLVVWVMSSCLKFCQGSYWA